MTQEVSLKLILRRNYLPGWEDGATFRSQYRTLLLPIVKFLPRTSLQSAEQSPAARHLACRRKVFGSSQAAAKAACMTKEGENKNAASGNPGWALSILSGCHSQAGSRQKSFPHGSARLRPWWRHSELVAAVTVEELLLLAGICLLAAATQCSAPGRALRWGQERSWLTFGQVQATPALATQGKACAFACGWVGTPLSVNTCAMLRPLPVDATTLELSPRQPLLYLPSCRGEPAAGWGHDICWGTSSNSASPRFYPEKNIGIRCEAAVEQTQNKITRSASTPGTEGLFLLCWTTSSMSKCFSVPGGGGPWCGGFCTSPRTGVTVGLT